MSTIHRARRAWEALKGSRRRHRLLGRAGRCTHSLPAASGPKTCGQRGHVVKGEVEPARAGMDPFAPAYDEGGAHSGWRNVGSHATSAWVLRNTQALGQGMA